MTWVYTYHRFADEVAYMAALDALEWRVEKPADDNEQIEYVAAPPAHNVALDVPGALYQQGEQIGTDDFDNPVYAMIPLDGWHVNAAWQGRAMPPAFASTEIHPETPDRMFASFGSERASEILG